MNWVIDLVLILVAALTIFLYTHKGFVKSFVGLFKYLISFALAYLFAPLVGKLIHEKIMFDKINGAVSGWMTDIVSNAENQMNVAEFLDKIPDSVGKLLEKFGMSVDALAEKAGDGLVSEGMISELSATVATPISTFVSNAIAYIGMFIIVLIGLTVAAFFLDKLIDKIPAVDKLNKTLGCVLGVFCAIINLLIVSLVITVILSITGISNPEMSVQAMSEKTLIYRLISGINVFALLF